MCCIIPFSVMDSALYGSRPIVSAQNEWRLFDERSAPDWFIDSNFILYFIDNLNGFHSITFTNLHSVYKNLLVQSEFHKGTIWRHRYLYCVYEFCSVAHASGSVSLAFPFHFGRLLSKTFGSPEQVISITLNVRST